MADGADVEIKTKSGKTIATLLFDLGKKTQKALERQLYLEGEGIMTHSKDGYVPIDTGTLKGSGFVERPVNTGSETVVVLGYGGLAAGYALFVHENMEVFHPTGEAKYLEIPFNLALRKMPERIAANMKKELK